MSTFNSDAAVIATNDDAFESKVAAMKVGYFQDPFLASMHRQYENLLSCRPDQFRRQPVINRGTFLRVLLKDHIVHSFLNQIHPSTHPYVQVLSLGAGFDSFPYKLFQTTSQTLPLHYVEVDLQPVVTQKRLLASDILKAADKNLFSHVLQDSDTIWQADTHSTPSHPACRYSLVACDLRDLDQLRAVLDRIKFRTHCPTIVLSELSLVYLPPEKSDAVMSFLARWLHDLHAIALIEPLQGADQFGKQMEANVAARGSPWLGMRLYGNLASQKNRLHQCGWRGTSAACTLLQHLKHCITPEIMYKLQRVEMLDEMEELNLLLQHYCVVVGVDDHLRDNTQSHQHRRSSDTFLNAMMKLDHFGRYTTTALGTEPGMH